MATGVNVCGRDVEESGGGEFGRCRQRLRRGLAGGVASGVSGYGDGLAHEAGEAAAETLAGLRGGVWFNHCWSFRGEGWRDGVGCSKVARCGEAGKKFHVEQG